MPTRDITAGYILENLEDVASAYYTATDCNNSIQDGYNLVAGLTGCIPKSATVAVDDEIYYDLSSSITDFLYLVGIFYQPQKRWLVPTTTQSLEAMRYDWELWTGSPFYVVPVTFNRVAIVPRPTSASGNFTVFYRAKANTLSGSDTPLVPGQAETILEKYGTADLLEQAREANKAQVYWQQFQQQLDAIDDSIFGLANAAKFNVMQPFDPMVGYPA